jgi:hypothetical protein
MLFKYRKFYYLLRANKINLKKGKTLQQKILRTAKFNQKILPNIHKYSEIIYFCG